MANLKEIRNRIASVSSTQQITSAMKMVSAAKLRKSQSAILKLRPYAMKMQEIMDKVGSSEGVDTPYMRQSDKEENVLLLVLTSNKGLCSTFNSSVIKAAIARIAVLKGEEKKVSVKSFGKKGDAAMKKLTDIEYLGSDDEIWDRMGFASVNELADKVMEDFRSRKYDRVEIIYNRFVNAASQVTAVENFLPIEMQSETKTANTDYIFEPDKTSIIENLIPMSLKTQMYKCFLDSFTSEHGARMTSMNKATDNAQALLKELKLTYNKARQTGITNEIIEICSGANALN